MVQWCLNGEITWLGLAFFWSSWGRQHNNSGSLPTSILGDEGSGNGGSHKTLAVPIGGSQTIRENPPPSFNGTPIMPVDCFVIVSCHFSERFIVCFSCLCVRFHLVEFIVSKSESNMVGVGVV